MRWRRGGSFGLLVAVSCLVGCAEPAFHWNGARFPAREPNCRLKLLGMPPGPDYVEIGTIIKGDRSGGAESSHDPAQFVSPVWAKVCAAGADAVVTEVNGLGVVVRGIVFKHVAPTPAAPAPETAAVAGGRACIPICSPGFDCRDGTCVPLCNPACESGETCGRDRLCHPAAGGASASGTSP